MLIVVLPLSLRVQSLPHCRLEPYGRDHSLTESCAGGRREPSEPPTFSHHVNVGGIVGRTTEFVHISELLPGSGRRARGPDPFRTGPPNLAHALSSSGRNRGSEICFPSLRCGMGASRSGVPPAREERQVARPPVCHSPSVACCAGQKTPSGSRQSQPYSARNVLPLQPLGPIPASGYSCLPDTMARNTPWSQ